MCKERYIKSYFIITLKSAVYVTAGNLILFALLPGHWEEENSKSNNWGLDSVEG